MSVTSAQALTHLFVDCLWLPRTLALVHALTPPVVLPCFPSRQVLGDIGKFEELKEAIAQVNREIVEVTACFSLFMLSAF